MGLGRTGDSLSFFPGWIGSGHIVLYGIGLYSAVPLRIDGVVLKGLYDDWRVVLTRVDSCRVESCCVESSCVCVYQSET